MVWHILKKDWKLLAPFVAALAVLQGFLALARFSAGPFLNGIPTTPMALLELLAVGIAIVLVVQQDPIPGVRQDWLVRPIPRRDLFLAKLLFVIVLVQGPMLVTDLLQGVANGFPFGQSAAAAIACAVWVLLTLTMPLLAFAALTASMTETLVAALGVFAALIARLMLPGVAGAAPAALNGFAWIPSLLREALLLVAAIGVVVLQYRWRRTWAARALFATALLVGLGAAFLPWRTTWLLAQTLTGGSGADHGIAIAFEPGAGRFRPAPGQGIDDVLERPGVGPVDAAAETQQRRAAGAITVFLPVHVSGLVPDSRLLADRSEVTVVGRDGDVVYRGTGNDFEIRATQADAIAHQGIRVPGAIYGRFKTEPLDLHVEYSLTLFAVGETYALPARDGNQRMPGIGWCATRVDAAGTRIQFQCLQPGERPSCLAVVLEHTPTKQRNPEVSLCAPDYSPFPGHTFPDAISRFGARLPFYDPSGMTRYLVGGPQLPESRVLVTAFRSTDHFIKRVVIPAVRLQEWEPQP